MQRRCTHTSCRRVFPIARTAPVRCPYCGTVYPRVQPDPHALRNTNGFSVRVDFTDHPPVEIARFFPGYRRHFRWFSQGGPMAIGSDLTLPEARQILQRFRLEGIPADVITTWDAQKQHLAFFRLEPI